MSPKILKKAIFIGKKLTVNRITSSRACLFVFPPLTEESNTTSQHPGKINYKLRVFHKGANRLQATAVHLPHAFADDCSSPTSGSHNSVSVQNKVPALLGRIFKSRLAGAFLYIHSKL